MAGLRARRGRERKTYSPPCLVDGACKQGFQLHDAWKHTSTTSSIVYANVFIIISAPQPFLKKILGLSRQWRIRFSKIAFFNKSCGFEPKVSQCKKSRSPTSLWASKMNQRIEREWRVYILYRKTDRYRNIHVHPKAFIVRKTSIISSIGKCYSFWNWIEWACRVPHSIDEMFCASQHRIMYKFEGSSTNKGIHSVVLEGSSRFLSFKSFICFHVWSLLLPGRKL